MISSSCTHAGLACTNSSSSCAAPALPRQTPIMRKAKACEQACKQVSFFINLCVERKVALQQQDNALSTFARL